MIGLKDTDHQGVDVPSLTFDEINLDDAVEAVDLTALSAALSPGSLSLASLVGSFCSPICDAEHVDSPHTLELEQMVHHV